MNSPCANTHCRTGPKGEPLPPRLVDDQGIICGRCADRLTSWLKAIPEWHATAEDSLSAHLHHGLYVTGTPDRGLRYNPRLLESLTLTRLILGGWCRIVCEEHGLPIRPADEVPELAAFLARYDTTRWLRHQWFVTEIIDEVRALRSRLRSVTDLSRDKSRFPVGACPEECDGVVWAYIPRTDDEPAVLGCDQCGQAWASMQWLRVGKRILAAKVQAAS